MGDKRPKKKKKSVKSNNVCLSFCNLCFLISQDFLKFCWTFWWRDQFRPNLTLQFSGWSCALRSDGLESVVCYSYLISSHRPGNLAALIASCLSGVLWPMTSQMLHMERHQHTANITDWDLNHDCCAMGKEKQRDLLIHSYIIMWWTNMHLACITFWKALSSRLLNSQNKKCRNTRAEFVLQNDEQLFHYYRTVQPGLWCPQLVWFSLTAWKCRSGDLSLTSHLRGLVSQRSPWYLPSVAAQGAILNCTRTIPGSKNILGDIFSSCGRLWSFTEINGLIEE